ncbi:hypothetical protein Dform_01545 [Dehalogenimonas formicexedens]|uniref:DUF2277 domain-containing protein n=1 Tax=Dehalogenimonas formicexedens TaxID=1839801 RepID=A0A1P8F8S4_9CHLR|nr:DUF2277 domain-containing protein [Dehalogenimonas formicexedens]APV44867.1 hypothetical protein Dform_01545 [Dehalogenimonas formicexedens]
MSRNIHMLFNFDPPATEEEVNAAAQQFVRKVSGFANPSAANHKAFDQAIREVSRATSKLLDSLVTEAPAKNREIEAAKRHARAVERFGRG